MRKNIIHPEEGKKGQISDREKVRQIEKIEDSKNKSK